jgi:hypothetical protein
LFCTTEYEVADLRMPTSTPEKRSKEKIKMYLDYKFCKFLISLKFSIFTKLNHYSLNKMFIPL